MWWFHRSANNIKHWSATTIKTSPRVPSVGEDRWQRKPCMRASSHSCGHSAPPRWTPSSPNYDYHTKWFYNKLIDMFMTNLISITTIESKLSSVASRSVMMDRWPSNTMKRNLGTLNKAVEMMRVHWVRSINTALALHVELVEFPCMDISWINQKTNWVND